MEKDCVLNCWEFKGCNKEKTCAAGTSLYGRICYAVAGTLCDNKVGGDFAEKYKDCRHCEYFKNCALKEKITKKKMCWEIKKCGRELGGAQADTKGVCPAANPLEGRACWVTAGTFCEGTVQGSFAQKIEDCRKCDFFQMAREERLCS